MHRAAPRPATELRPAIHALGPVEAVRAGESVTLTPAQRRLLAILCHAGDAEVEVGTLIDRMWGDDPPKTARTSLQMHVSALRRTLSDELLTTPHGYRLAARPADVVEVERDLGEADDAAGRGDWVAVLALTEPALRRWRGPALADVADEIWALAELQRIESVRARLVEQRLQALLAVERHTDAAELARAELGRDPLDEGRWRTLILALYQAGRPSDALRAFRDADDAIRSELGIPPGAALRELENLIRFDDPSLRGVAAGEEHNLPEVGTSFIGREEDRQAVEELLSAHRAVTLLGPPGVGKTRLAVEVARLVLDHHPDGTWFCSLAGAGNERDVLSIVTAATRTRHQVGSIDELAERLAARHALVILDNCEHVVEPCRRLVRRLARRGGSTQVLATSRTALGYPGERTRVIAPLALPATSPRPSPPADALATASVQLFTDRARVTDPTFRLGAQTVPIAAEVCRLAGGIPLAIELAASWLPAIGVADLRKILGPDLTFRADGAPGGRTDTSLGTAIDRSIGLLTPVDRNLLRALAVFRGPFTLTDVLAVCAPGGTLREVAGGIARLAEASLLVVERRPAGGRVYRLLTPIREYLVAGRRDAGTEAAFARHYLEEARAWCPDPMQTGGDLAQMDDDIDNVRAALKLGMGAGEVNAAGHAIRALQGYFYDRYLQWEGIRWIRSVLDRVDDALLLAWLVRALGSAAHNTNDVEGAARHLADALRRFRRLRHHDGAALSLLSIAQVHATRGEWRACRRAADRARRLLGPRGSRSGLAVAAYYIGEGFAYDGEVRRALPSLARAARLFEETQQLHRAAYALSTLVMTAVLGGLEAEARAHAPRAIELARRSGSGYRLTRALSAASAVEARWGEAAVARELLVEAHGYLGPLITDVVNEFALPAGFLLRRLAAWDFLLEMLAEADGVAAGGALTISVPWQRQIAAWRTDAAAQGRAVAHRRPAASMSGERLSTRTLAALDQAQA